MAKIANLYFRDGTRMIYLKVRAKNFEIKVGKVPSECVSVTEMFCFLEQSKQSTNFLTKPTGKSINTHYSALIPYHFPLFQNSQ